jgi:hypothetical protein
VPDVSKLSMLRRLNTRLLSSLSVDLVTPEVRSIVEDLPEGRGSMGFPLTARGHAMDRHGRLRSTL